MLIISFSNAPLMVTAQPGVVIPYGYDMGWESDEDAEKGFMIEEDGTVLLHYWIQNYYQWEITVELEYDLPFDASTSSDESVSVGAGENVSMKLAINGIDVLSNKAKLEKSININAGAYTAEQVPDPESKSISSSLIIPHITGFSLEISNPPGAINSGGETEIDLTIENTGNAEDKITSPNVYHKQCPQLQIENVDKLEGMTIDAAFDGKSGSKMHTIKIIAPSSHPSKNCDISIAISSKSASEKGNSNPSDEDGITIEIRKGSSSTSEDNSNKNTDTKSDGDPDDPEDVVSKNFAPSIGIMEISLVLLIVAFYRKKY